MITYKSLTGMTVPFMRYQITPTVGIELATSNQYLDELVLTGVLSKTDDSIVEVVKPDTPVKPPTTVVATNTTVKP